MASPLQGTGTEQVGFAPRSEVEVRQSGDIQWVTLGVLTYQGKDERFEVPKGFQTDFASVPRPFVWFLPRYGRYTKAAILHDYLCNVEVEAGALSRADADGIFRQAMRSLDVPFLRRWIMWAAVRLGALARRTGRQGWFGDSWRVVAVAVVALPIVAPAAAVILLTMPVFYLAELLVWLGLLAGRRLPRSPAQPTKRINKPNLRLKL
jgi:hypothetical protein